MIPVFCDWPDLSDPQRLLISGMCELAQKRVERRERIRCRKPDRCPKQKDAAWRQLLDLYGPEAAVWKAAKVREQKEAEANRKAAEALATTAAPTPPNPI